MVIDYSPSPSLHRGPSALLTLVFMAALGSSGCVYPPGSDGVVAVDSCLGAPIPGGELVLDRAAGSPNVATMNLPAVATVCLEVESSVASGEVSIDGIEVLGRSEFKNREQTLHRVVGGLEPVQHVVRAEIASKPARYLRVTAYYAEAGQPGGCRPLGDEPSQEEYEVAAKLAIIELEAEGLWTSEDPLAQVADRTAEILNLCPDLELENGENILGDEDVFRHNLPPGDHDSCELYSPWLDYNSEVQYCGRKACAPGTIGGPYRRTLHYVNSCVNEECRAHDQCYDELNPHWLCLWSTQTARCDDELADLIQSPACPTSEDPEACESDGYDACRTARKTDNAKGAIQGMADAARTRNCCTPVLNDEPGFVCAEEGLEGQPDVHYCFRVTPQASGAVELALKRSDNSPFGSWDIAVDATLEVGGRTIPLEGDCKNYDGEGKTIITRTVTPPFHPWSVNALTGHVRVGPTNPECEAAPRAEVSTVNLDCELL